jgi:hypothetical protein
MSNNFFRKSCRVRDKIKKKIVDTKTLQMIIWQRVACWISKATRTQVNASSREPIHTQTYASTRTHMRAHICTLKYEILAFFFPRQQRLDVKLHKHCLSCLNCDLGGTEAQRIPHLGCAPALFSGSFCLLRYPASSPYAFLFITPEFGRTTIHTQKR